MVFKLLPSASSSPHETLAARGLHEVFCAGDSSAIRTVVDACHELKSHSSLSDDGSMSFPFWVVMQLLVPLVGPDDLSKWRIALWSRFIDPSALSPAFTAVVASEHFDETRSYSSLNNLFLAAALCRV